MKNKSILFHRGVPWNGDVRGSTNLIAGYFLEQGYATAWLRRLRHFGHWIRDDRSQPVAERHSDGMLDISPWSVFPRMPWRCFGASIYAKSSLLAYSTMRPRLDELFQKFEQTYPDIIWSCGGDGGKLRKSFPHAKRIVQCVDHYGSFAGNSQHKIERLDYEDADAVVSIGFSLAEHLKSQFAVPESKITVIGQGADLPLYQREDEEPEELADAPHPRLVWVGVLEKIDPCLMRAALDSLPRNTGSLILIGPETAFGGDLARNDERVKLLGPKIHTEVPAFLKHCDVGLMLYDQSVDLRKYDGQNPLKLYEYAAAGLPIVSTPHAEFLYTKPPVTIVSTPAEVCESIKSMIENDIVPVIESLEFAKANSWRSRFRDCESLIERLLSQDIR